MTANRWEGIFITFLGLFFLIASLDIAPNPVKSEGWINFLIEAKSLPLLLSGIATLLGIAMVLKNTGEQVDIAASITRLLTDSMLIRMVVLVIINLLYVLLIGTGIQFIVLTFLYLALSMACVNFKEIGTVKILISSAAATFFVAYVLPWSLSIQLP